MADRVTVEIIFGGRIPRAAIPKIIAAAEAEGLLFDFSDDLTEIVDGPPIHLGAHEVNYGLIDEFRMILEAHNTPYWHWFDGYTGSWGEGLIISDGQSVVEYAAWNGEPAILVKDIHKTETRLADFVVPNVEVVE
jgi:hypothetical protein